MPITLGVQLPWTCPAIFSGFLVTGSIMGSVVQIVQIVLNVVIYYPFFKVMDDKYLAEEKANADTKDEVDDLSFDDLSLD